MKTLNSKRYTTLMFIAAPFTIADTWKQPKCIYIYICVCVCVYICVCVCLCVCVYTHTYIYTCGILLSRENEILPCTSIRMDLKSIMLSDKSQTEKDRYCVLSGVISGLVCYSIHI